MNPFKPFNIRPVQDSDKRLSLLGLLFVWRGVVVGKVLCSFESHRIHVWYIYLHLVEVYGIHVGKYTSPMDPMFGMVIMSKRATFFPQKNVVKNETAVG